MDYPEPCAQNFIHLIMGPRSECLCCRKESSKGHGIRCTGNGFGDIDISDCIQKVSLIVANMGNCIVSASRTTVI